MASEIDLFNLNPEDFTGAQGSTRKIDENLYNPSPDQGQNGIYKAIIRFVPWAEDPSKSKYKKYSAKLVNPLTNEKLFVDCPSTTGAPSILWTLDTELKRLKEEEPDVHKEISKYFNRYYNYYSCIYIKKDPQFPALEGKIKVYSFGFGIDNLIQQELKPEQEIVTVKSVNPYSLLEGKDLVLVVKRKTKTWREYSASKFMNDVTPLLVTHNGKNIAASTDPKVSKFILEFLKQNSPDLSQYFMKPWTEEEYVKIAEFIKAIVPYKTIIDNLIADLRDEKMKSLFTNTQARSAIRQSTQTIAKMNDLEFTPSSQTKGQDLTVDLPTTNQPEAVADPGTDFPESDPESDFPPIDETPVSSQAPAASQPATGKNRDAELNNLFDGL